MGQVRGEPPSIRGQSASDLANASEPRAAGVAVLPLLHLSKVVLSSRARMTPA